ncbi:MAG TPA: aminotransferase class V-fold PLP-dependent enzyme [Bryobacteraceae bacterium]|nr:aminotransferase class V-fold PLP-dependent enzyme [Bryobacteraceae bacterium]
MTDWAAVRAQFPALRGWTYLNTATYGQLSTASANAIQCHLAHRDDLACTDFLKWFDDVDTVRDSIGQLIGATRADIAFLTNACSGLSLLIDGLEWKPGDRIVTLEHEFPNNLYITDLIERRGATLDIVEPDALLSALEGARAVVCSMVNYVSGYRVPLAELSRRCREHGTLLYIDGTQALGGLTLDLRTTPLDMLVVHGYKWLLSPNGAAFAYVSPALREHLKPNIVGWRSDHAWREVDALHHGAPRYSDAAEKYEGGMVSFPNIFAMGESVRLMLDIGPEVIESRVLSLAAYARTRFEALGFPVQHPDSPILSVALPPTLDPSLVSRKLMEQRIVVSARHGHLRVSAHLYNNEADVDSLTSALGNF